MFGVPRPDHRDSNWGWWQESTVQTSSEYRPVKLLPCLSLIFMHIHIFTSNYIILYYIFRVHFPTWRILPVTSTALLGQAWTHQKRRSARYYCCQIFIPLLFSSHFSGLVVLSKIKRDDTSSVQYYVEFCISLF